MMSGGRAELSMMQTVQLSIADAEYGTALREALARSGPWHLESVERPDLSRRCVVVLDEDAFHRLSLPVPNPERVVLITRKEPFLLAQAWDAGIVSVVSDEDPVNTVLLAIMAAALRVAKSAPAAGAGGISPSSSTANAPIAPPDRSSSTKRCKTP
jgi:hypothetical protein